jgi:hypothetical protein
MVAEPSFRCFGFDKPIISENGNLVHHDHPHQAPPEFLKRLQLEYPLILARSDDFSRVLQNATKVATAKPSSTDYASLNIS